MIDAARLPLSVLDLAWRGPGQSTANALADSLALAQAAEDMGYHRHWFAAHHGLPVSAASQPLTLMGAAAAATSTIRVGSAPLLLSLYSPLAVAEQAGTLRAIYGDRIDLGVGRSSGGFPAHLIRRTRHVSDTSAYPSDVIELLDFFRGFPQKVDAGVVPTAVPGLGDEPEVWILGSNSGFSAHLAGALSLPFAYAHHFGPDDTERVLDAYRAAFVPTEALPQPRTMVTMMLATAESHESLREDMRLSDLTHLRLLRGHPATVPSDEELRAHSVHARDREVLDARLRRQAVGTPDVIEANISSLIASTGVDELMFQVASGTHDARERSLRIAAGLRLCHSDAKE